jgi:hypothetical protein
MAEASPTVPNDELLKESFFKYFGERDCGEVEDRSRDDQSVDHWVRCSARYQQRRAADR